MMKRKLLAVVLGLALVLGSIGMAFADEPMLISAGPAFADMPDNWSTAALNNAVENQLIRGYEENGTKLIKADNSLTRAEMAAVVNRAFASASLADISKAADVESWAWYAKDMAKAVKMGTFALDTKMRPGDKITRQEAFAVLSRAFKLAGADDKYKALDKFSDKGNIAAWALKDLDGMAAAGYIQGSDGKLNPTANITRAEFAVVMNNLVKQYIDEAGTVTQVVAAGNVMVRVPGVTLKNVTVKGDLIIADGVGEGDVTLDNVKVEGRTVVRGGGENSIVIKGNSNIGKIIVSKIDGKVRVSVEGGAEVDIIYVDDGSDEVKVEGTVGTLEIAGGGVTVSTEKATITKLEVTGDSAKVVVGAGTSIKESTISGTSSGITVNTGAKVDAVTISGSNAKIDGAGQVPKVTVAAGGNNASITTPNTVTTVSSGTTGVTAGGTAVPAGGTATNNSTGSGATVTQPTTGGGGSGGLGSDPPLLISIVKVTANSQEVTPAGTHYIIPSAATKNNTGINVAITNTKNVAYGVSIDIKNGNSTVAHAEVAGIQQTYLDLLSDFGEVTFADIGNMFDRLGTSRSGYYYDAGGSMQTLGTNQAAFEAAIDTLFSRMGGGDIYTVIVKLTPAGGTAAELEFTVAKQ
ncbi:hypothetical protein MASR2M70_03740 [Bacillota bacterium]